MVCENTNAAVVGDNTNLIEVTEAAARKARSPLLPDRHQRDFFVCDVFDAAPKGDAASMEHPIFSLSKKPDMKARRYENGSSWAEVRPSFKGLATVFDRDILIYCISQLMAALNDGRQVSQTLRLRGQDLLVAPVPAHGVGIHPPAAHQTRLGGGAEEPGALRRHEKFAPGRN